ncbi:serine/threonine-protein kinase [Methylobacter sp.]|uniref:serine/threonine-protein kinase n=1 Tax=Methylobacter sp. TaxID=2051955 RepID=UPI003DA26729
MEKLCVGGKTVLKGRFVLQEVLGQGGMGTVYKALDLVAQEAHDKDPYLAIKLLNPEFLDDPIFFVAMQREAKKAKSLAHPNIITVYDFDRDADNVYLSMQLLKGRPLSSIIKEYPSGMPFKKAWPIIQDMAAALSHAHKNGIVHSDFKPGNVFVDDKGHVKVLDFGIACPFKRTDQTDDDATVFHSRSLNALSPAYASLEMLNNLEPDPRDDIYALACIAYELLSGKHPFSRSTAQQAFDLKVQPAPITSITKSQWKGLQHGLALKQENRCRTISQFIKEISPEKRYKSGAIAAASLFSLGLLAVLLWLFYGKNEPGYDVAKSETQKQTPSDKVEANAVQTDTPADRQHQESTVATVQHEPLKLRSSAPSYRIGEAMTLLLETEKAMYVTIVHISTDGEISTIFPNAYEPNNWIAAGQKIRLPKKNAGYELTVSGPSGTDRIEAFGSAEPLPVTENIINPDGKLNPQLQSYISSRVSLTVPVL